MRIVENNEADSEKGEEFFIYSKGISFFDKPP